MQLSTVLSISDCLWNSAEERDKSLIQDILEVALPSYILTSRYQFTVNCLNNIESLGS